MKSLATVAVLVVAFGSACAVRADDPPLRVICFGAHPDDCELKAGGVAALWAAKGVKVKFVSVTNGDIESSGCPIASAFIARLAGVTLDSFELTSKA